MPSIDYSKQTVKFNVKTADGIIDSINGKTDKTITVNGVNLSESSDAEKIVQLFTDKSKGLELFSVADGEELTITAETTTTYHQDTGN